MQRILFLFMVALFISACSWVELTDEGKNIRVVSLAEVKACKKMGTIMVSVKYQIAGFDRSHDTMKQELEDLARNIAIDLKGDSIVSTSTIKKGKQTYTAYKCINPAVTK